MTSRRERFGLLLAILAGCSRFEGPPAVAPGLVRAEALATAYTTRLPATDPTGQAIAVAQAMYAATGDENRPQAVVLCRPDAAEAYTAIQRFANAPIDAPLLYLDARGGLGDRTRRELERLAPRGVASDGGTQVYVVGQTEPPATRSARLLGFRVRELRAESPVALAEILDRWHDAVTFEAPVEIVVSSLDDPQAVVGGLGTATWNTRRGRSFAWVRRNTIPEPSRSILERRGRSHAEILVVGGPRAVSDRVVAALSRYGLVRRIAGDTPAETSVLVAGLRTGGDGGRWWGPSRRELGWGVGRAGQSVVVAADTDALGAVATVPLGRLGGRGPILLVDRKAVPARVAWYLDSLRPTPAGATAGLRSHAWIVGDESRVSWAVQREVDGLLRPAAPSEPDLLATDDGGPDDAG